MQENAEVDLLGLPPDEMERALARHFEERGQPSFRTDQVRHWLYEGLGTSFDEITTLPKEEREALGEAFRITELEPHVVSRSADGTVKHLWRLDDGELVESVLIPTKDRLTLCISSQAGCALGCTFCATGWGGFARQLSTGEIVAQYRGAQRWAREHEDEGYGRISNVVYMGMGEPMANREAVFPSLTLLNQAYGIGARHITVSTVGLVPGIVELANRPEQFTLAVSLHAPNHELRKTLIPLEKRYPLPELMEALRTYRLRSSRRITFEYTMIRGVNDAPELAQELADLAEEVEAFVNLIPFNPIPDQDWEPSRPEEIERFAAILRDRDIDVEVRTPRGRDIDAACGQLRAKNRAQVA
ncbi:MAG: 23S rRNA (adenine(2503)-C(2))-methyltransferase RlmN [Longimicrobiales bacterium]|nr:23S rRNA (adenine(2503)-C(2))-methyltransferase RlmN [Longimicrobiales bacterium]